VRQGARALATRSRLLWLLVFALLSGACGGGGGIEELSAEEIFGQAVTALGNARSFKVRYSSADSSGRMLLELSVSRRGAVGTVDQTIEGKRARYELTVIGGRQYIKGRSFWEAFGEPGDAARVGDGWGWLSPGPRSWRSPWSWATCVLGSGYHGAPLRKGGTTEVGGRRAVVVIDPGGRPGTYPDRVAVAASGPPYPLTAEQTGPAKAGTSVSAPACGGEVRKIDGSVHDSRFTYSAFDADVRVEIPEGAVDVDALRRQRPQ
jgi:hypothetical protein